MKRSLYGLIIAVCALTGAAQEPDASIHDALRQLKATMTKALNERDLNAIVANVDENVVFTTMNGDVCRGPQQIRAYFHKMLEAPGHIVKDVKVSFEADALTTLYGGDAGVAIGSSNDHYELTNGDTFDIRGRWTCTMVRKPDGRWVIAAFHYSADVFRNPIVDRLKGALYQLGIGGAIAGLFLGFLTCWLLLRRKAAA
ncbi:MAG TPA: nuclear transport factor 2 family protein [Thermoanaerobaculia bacterium]|nr:nuclear transport factor 2 family protein [Thermoanaerobaculia bacterium]